MKSDRNIRIMYAFSFLKNLLFFGALAVPFYLDRIGLNYTQMFFLETVFSVSMIFFEIPTGVIADRYGRKISLFAGSIFFGAAFLFFGICTSYISLLVLEIICACGMTMLSGADRALVFDSLRSAGRESEADSVMSRYDAFSTAGMLVSFPVGSVFADSGILDYNTSLGAVFVATGIAIMTGGLVILFLTEEGFHRPSESALKQGINGFLFIFRHRKLRFFSLNYSVISSLTFFMFWFYQSLLIENRFPVSGMGFIAAALNATAMFLLLLTPAVRRIMGLNNILFYTSFIPGIMYIAAGAVSGLPMAIAAIFIITNMKIFRAPLLSALMNEHIESSNRATVLSGVSMTERIITAVLYPVSGMLMDLSLKHAFFAIGSVTVLLSFVMRTDVSGER